MVYTMVKKLKPRVCLGLFCLCIACTPLKAETDNSGRQEFVVKDAFIDLYAGSELEYPVFDIVERGESIWLIKRYTDWFKVRTKQGKEGWVSLENLALGLNISPTLLVEP